MARQPRYRTAFITGASSGIGRSLALRLAADGLEVAVAARREEALRALAAEIEAAGGRARVYPLDVADPDATVATLERADDDLGGIDLVVANAGISSQRWSGKLRWGDVAPTLAVNVSGAAATLVALAPRMVARKRGHLVGVSSLAGYRGLPRSAAYAGSKAFLSMFLESLRVDLRSTGVAVTDVRSGFVRTPMTEGAPFPMPLLMTADKAAELIAEAIDRRQAVLAYPWPLAAAVRGSRLLTPGVWDVVMNLGRGR